MSTPNVLPEGVSDVGNDMLLEQVLLASYVAYMENAINAEDTVPQQVKREQTPPASEETLKKLPILELRDEDLLDPVNRECCVCLDLHEAGDKAVRLPFCGHLFHQECIHDWLQRKCTCPVCRFEHPTDDEDYEQDRLERIRNSKPRYTHHELDRMSQGQLMEFLKDNTNKEGDEMSQSELVERVIEVGAVDVINTPKPPIEYTMALLRKMSVSQLRKSMNKEAGVFFSKEVTKKDDMIEVFLNSGRLHLLKPATKKEKKKTSQEKEESNQEKKRDASIKRGSSRRLRTKIRRLCFGHRN